MIRTKFDERFREIPVDTEALKKARRQLENDLPSALSALEKEPTELDQIDYYRLLSRTSDLDRFEFSYSKALLGFESTSTFWKSIDWGKAAFLCDLKAALCRGYLQEERTEHAFEPLFERMNEDEGLLIYQFFLYQYRGQIFAFHGNQSQAETDFLAGLERSKAGRKKKQTERFLYFIQALSE